MEAHKGHEMLANYFQTCLQDGSGTSLLQNRFDRLVKAFLAGASNSPSQIDLGRSEIDLDTDPCIDYILRHGVSHLHHLYFHHLETKDHVRRNKLLHDAVRAVLSFDWILLRALQDGHMYGVAASCGDVLKMLERELRVLHWTGLAPL